MRNALMKLGWLALPLILLLAACGGASAQPDTAQANVVQSDAIQADTAQSDGGQTGGVQSDVAQSDVVQVTGRPQFVEFYADW